MTFDLLKEYINNSEKIEINPFLCISLSKELKDKYDRGLYQKQIQFFETYIESINHLGLQYPNKENPVFYIYIVPDDSFIELLNHPQMLNKKGGGNPVPCYDIDGFCMAYGCSSNILENPEDLNISQTVNHIHELAHLIYSKFNHRSFCRMLEEGFAECFTFYTMDYESIFLDHKEALTLLKQEQILSAAQLLHLSKKHLVTILFIQIILALFV